MGIDEILATERVLTVLLVLMVLGLGTFFSRSVWPKLSAWIEDGRRARQELELKRLEAQTLIEERRLEVQREQGALWRQLSRDIQGLEGQIQALREQQGVLIDAVGRLASTMAVGHS